MFKKNYKNLILSFRELRGSFNEFKIVVASIFLGVFIIAAVGSISENLKSEIKNKRAEMLGGNFELSTTYQEFPKNLKKWLEENGATTQIIELRTMLSYNSQSQIKRRIVELKAVDNNYPLIGKVVISPNQELKPSLNTKKNTKNVLIDKSLKDQLGINVGDLINLGKSKFKINGIIEKEPDRMFSFATFGPRVLLSTESLIDTGLLKAGSLIKYKIKFIPNDDKKIKAPPGGNIVVAQDMTNIDAFIEAQDAAKEAGKKADLLEQAPSPADEIDNFLLGVDDGSINLNNLDFQVSASDVPLQGKFDRLKYLRTLRKDNRITNSRYISLTAPLKLSIEEAALLESREIGRDVDPSEISSDPILMYKYGLIELDDDLAETIDELQKAGVDVTADVPSNIRLQVGRQSGEEAKLQALENLKQDGQILFYKPTKLGMVITIPEFNEQGAQIGTQDVLFDELGLDGNDFLDIISVLELNELFADKYK